MNSRDPLPVSVVVVGCGTVSENAYLPICQSGLDGVRVSWVVDTNERRAREAAAEFDVPNYTTDYREAFADADVVIVATPPTFHAEIARDCLDAGLHVLTEKPLALSEAEATDLVELAADRGVRYGVPHPRRHLPSVGVMKTLLDGGYLGEVDSFRIEEGRELGHEYKSLFRFDRDRAWGGTLTDMGPHLLDVLLWYFDVDGGATVDRYRDDSLGGVEANVELALTLDPGSGSKPVSGTVVISDTRSIDGTFELHGEDGWLETTSDRTVRLHTADDRTISCGVEPDGDYSTDWVDRMRYQIEQFVAAVRDDETDSLPASRDRDVVGIVETCYDRRETRVYPWEVVDGTSARVWSELP